MMLQTSVERRWPAVASLRLTTTGASTSKLIACHSDTRHLACLVGTGILFSPPRRKLPKIAMCRNGKDTASTPPPPVDASHRRSTMAMMFSVILCSLLLLCFQSGVDAFSVRPAAEGIAAPLPTRPASSAYDAVDAERHLRRLNLQPPATPRSTQSSTILRAATSAEKTAEGAEPVIPPHTIQILMSDTGGGHRASANALRDALSALYPAQFQVDIVDVYTDYGPFPYNQYVAAYKIMAAYPFLWDWFYHFGATPVGLALNEFFLDVFCFEPFRECLGRCTPLPTEGGGEISAAEAKAQSCLTTDRRADMVVSVHPLCQDETIKILAHLDSGGKSKAADGRTKTPFVTVVTDLGGAHPTWFNPGVDKCYVPSDVLYQAALDRQLKPDQIVEYGLPIRKGFWSTEGRDAGDADDKAEKGKGGWLAKTFGRGGDNQGSSNDESDGGGKKNKSELRTELGLVQSVPTVLIVGGGDGMGGIVEQARAVGRRLNADAANVDASSTDGPAFQMVVVCGNNQEAQKQLAADEWGDGVSVDVKGFVYNMDEYMRASDAIVTKAGPGTIAEASICGLPCMLSSYLPGQEAGNVPYVEENGFGTYSGDPTVIAETVSSWLETPEKLQQMQTAALEAARPAATLDIARDIAEYLFERKGISIP